MKRFIIFLTIILALTGCSFNNSSKYFEKVAGTYKIFSVKSKDKVYTV